MKLPPHYHSDLMEIALDVERELAAFGGNMDLAARLKAGVAALGVKTQATAGHFYSPAVDPNTIGDYYTRRWKKRADPAALDMVNLRKMGDLWHEMLPLMQDFDFNENKASDIRYYYKNNYFGIADACTLVGMFRLFQPRRVIEIGSGFSSALLLDLSDLADWPVSTRFVEPYPDVRLNKLLRHDDEGRIEIFPCLIQDVDEAMYSDLKKNDILFIDSTHVLKSGSDVVRLYCDILGNLPSGVLVHVHDIFYPFEYPPHWVVEQNRSWNEAYVLHAFLTNNSRYEVLFFNDAFGLHCRDQIEETLPIFLSAGGHGGSIWLRAN